MEHRYDPGYYLGGRIPPFLRRRRDGGGNQYGYVLIVGAVMTMILGLGSYRSAESNLIVGFYLLIAALQLVAGVRLARATQNRPKR